MPTYNTPDCTCGLDHDGLEHLITSTLLQLEAEQRHYTPEEVGSIVEDAALYVGWHRDTDLAVKTYNGPDCTCEQDHDDLAHIVAVLLILALEGGTMTTSELIGHAERAAAAVGWVKP